MYQANEKYDPGSQSFEKLHTWTCMITPDSFQVLFWSTAQHIFNKCNLIFTTHLFWRWPVLFLSLHRLHRHWFQLGFSVLLQDGCNYPGSIDPHDFDSSSQNITAWNRITTKTLWQWRISRHKSRRRLLYQNESSVPSQNPKWRADV